MVMARPRTAKPIVFIRAILILRGGSSKRARAGGDGRSYFLIHIASMHKLMSAILNFFFIIWYIGVFGT